MTLLQHAPECAALLHDRPDDEGRRAGAADRALMLLLVAREGEMGLGGR